MCLGENSAHHASSYVNGQLGALYSNATKCVKEVGGDLEALDRVRYDFALAEFHVGSRHQSKTASKGEAKFSAEFDKPELEFICSHEVDLHLHIKKGHVVNLINRVELTGVKVTFRVEFSVNNIGDHTSKIGQGSHIIRLLVLDLHSAQVVSEINNDVEEALPYLREYLDFLHHAGQNILFSLPKFDDSRLDLIVDYSLAVLKDHNADVEINKVDEVFGVSLTKINKQLSSRWEAAKGGENRSAKCLAEYQSIWTSLGDDVHAGNRQFHVKFGAPEVQALCKREVILYFNINELLVYNDTDFAKDSEYTFSNWRIAVVVDIIKDVKNTIKLDIETLRFCEDRSKFNFDGYKATAEPTDWAVKLKSTFIEFIIDYYAAVLEQAGFHRIYVPDVTKPDNIKPININDISESGEKPASMEEIVQKSNMHGFDSIQVISQYTIIEHFKTLWVQAHESQNDSLRGLYQWSYSEDFKGTFDAFSLRILPNDKAIIWINLSGGSFIPLESTTEVDVSGWSLAFEVGFALFDQEEVSKMSLSWLSRFTNSIAWEKHGARNDRTLKHLCLDLRNPGFIYELSKFGSVNVTFTYVMRAVHYFTDYYFPHLVQNGYNILHSIPVWKTVSNSPNMGLTNVGFQTYSKHNQKEFDYRHLSRDFKAVVVLRGMTGPRELPSVRLPYSTDWIFETQGNTPHGTVIISKERFLQERLLMLLAQVNTTSTIVPIFHGADGMDPCVPVITEGGNLLALTTWACRYHNKTRSDCQWERKDGSQTDYKWDHTDKWSYQHEGADNDRNNGVYTVVCVTDNVLKLPKAGQGSMDINLSGKVTIQLSFKESHSWDMEATASWSVTLSLNTLPDGGGITVDVTGNTRPRFKRGNDKDEKSRLDMNALHNLLKVDLSDLTSDLEQTFGGDWEHCFPRTGAYSLNNPILNNHGDIIFDLRPSTTRSPATVGRVSLFSQGSATPAPLPAPTGGPSPFLQRVSDGIVNAGQTIGEMATKAVIGNKHDSNGHAAEGNGYGNGSAPGHAEGNVYGDPVIFDTKDIKGDSGFFKSKEAIVTKDKPADVEPTAH